MPPIIEIEALSKTFGDFTAVDGIDLTVERGELFSLLGASGSGKTTLLRMLAGFERPTAGRLVIDGVEMSDVPPYERPVNMVFQSYALFPHMSVAHNVAFGLKQDRLPRHEIGQRVAAMLDLVQMSRFADRRPHQLSGGQKQRVALARALVKQPKVLLLDEPLSALDKKLREETQLELVNLQDRLGTTFVMVTHDQEEAMTMSYRIAVMHDGRIAQVGTPVDIYEYPASRTVAAFIGTANLFDGTVTGVLPDEIHVDAGTLGVLHVARMGDVPVGSRVTVMVRPEKMTLGRTPSGSEVNRLSGVVRDIGYLGDISIYHVRLDDGGPTVQVSQANLRHNPKDRLTWNERVHLGWHPANAVVLTR